MRAVGIAMCLLVSAPISAEEAYEPLFPLRLAASVARAEIIKTCPPEGVETSEQWIERCVPMSARMVEEKLRVLDGDTIEVEGEVIRLENIDAPETDRARCDAERLLGERAKADIELLLPNDTQIRRAGKDKYGRTLARLMVFDGADVGDTLIEMGSAVPYDGGKRPSWCG